MAEPILPETPDYVDDVPARRTGVAEARWIKVEVVTEDGKPVPSAIVERLPSESMEQADLATWAGNIELTIDQPARKDSTEVAATSSSLRLDDNRGIYVTDSTGCCLVPWDDELLVLIASKDDLGSSREVDPWTSAKPCEDAVPCPPGMTLNARCVQLVLRPAAVLMGVVQMSNGAPASNLPVFVGKTRGNGDAVAPVAQTGGDGEFQALINSPTTADVWAESGSASSLAERVYFRPGAKYFVALQLCGEYMIAVETKPADDAPLEEARASAWLTGRDRPVASSLTGNGSCQLTVCKPGDYEIIVESATQLQAGPANIVLTPIDREARVTIPMIAKAELSGRVTWTSGKPVAGALVEAKAVGAGRSATQLGYEERLRDHAQADEAGMFKLRRIRPDYAYSLTASDKSVRVISDNAICKAGDTDVHLVLKDQLDSSVEGKASLRILDAVSHNPVPGAEGWYFPWDGEQRQDLERSGAVDGLLTMSEMREWRDYGAEVRCRGYADALVGPFRTSDPQPIVVFMERPGGVRVKVESADGEDVRGCRLSFARVSADGTYVVCERSISGVGGVATVGGLAPGRYALFADGGERVSGLTYTEIVADRSVDVLLRVGAGRGSVAVAVSCSGAPLESAAVLLSADPACGTAYIGEGCRQLSRTNSEGEALFTDVAAGMYRARVYCNSRLVGDAGIIVESQGVGRATVQCGE